ncbi:MAG: GNAT family protein [candidate division Zixibacteria bacterium]|nr:GNAT family protein [candidate division Zixibacteria bacterium]MDD5426385.1 GNAT family protein [candidate division Zixibacteria bacterium]
MTTNKNENNLKRVRFLESERLFLTPITIDDIDENYLWDHDRDMQFLDGWTHRPQYYENFKEDFSGIFKSKKSMFLCIILKEDGTYIGNIVLFNIADYERICEWGIKLDKKYHRQGYATEASLLLIRYVFEDLGYVRLHSGTHSKNEASIKLQEKLGFVKEGVFRQQRLVNGEYLDSLQYGMLKEDYEKVFKQ